MKIISKTNMHICIAAYLLGLDREKPKALTKKEKQEISEVLWNSLNMLQSLKEPIDPMILDNALANLLAYIVSNGKETPAEKYNHLSRIVLKTKLILEMVEQTPLAELLDYYYGKKKHPLTGILKNH